MAVLEAAKWFPLCSSSFQFLRKFSEKCPCKKADIFVLYLKGLLGSTLETGWREGRDAWELNIHRLYLVTDNSETLNNAKAGDLEYHERALIQSLAEHSRKCLVSLHGVLRALLLGPHPAETMGWERHWSLTLYKAAGIRQCCTDVRTEKSGGAERDPHIYWVNWLSTKVPR